MGKVQINIRGIAYNGEHFFDVCEGDNCSSVVFMHACMHVTVFSRFSGCPVEIVKQVYVGHVRL